MTESAYENEDILQFLLNHTQIVPPTINSRFQFQLVT
jgi:hypothetical protein